MVWFVKALRLKSDLKWNLIAESDENGGFRECCTHGHDTAEAAIACDEAQNVASRITGFPRWKTDEVPPIKLSDAQIKWMVGRFLAWKLPEDFNPDGGVSFTRMFNVNTPWPSKAEPSGTNLLDARQAEAMIRHITGNSV